MLLRDRPTLRRNDQRQLAERLFDLKRKQVLAVAWPIEALPILDAIARAVVVAEEDLAIRRGDLAIPEIERERHVTADVGVRVRPAALACDHRAANAHGAEAIVGDDEARHDRHTNQRALGKKCERPAGDATTTAVRVHRLIDEGQLQRPLRVAPVHAASDAAPRVVPDAGRPAHRSSRDHRRPPLHRSSGDALAPR